MPELTMAAALNRAMSDAMSSDESVLVFGEDVGKLGGVFRVTQGLQERFGDKRCFDTPLAEAGIAGIAVGLALNGFRPVIEMQFDAFSYPALDQVISHIAKYRTRSRGKLGMPITIRIPVGGGIGAAESHSDSPETYYAHTAGLKVVSPSCPSDAYELLSNAIADPDPVVVCEPKSQYWSTQDFEPSSNGSIIGKAKVVREGEHATLIAWGAMVARCLEAADHAAMDNVSLEVVDVRSLVPLDEKTLCESAVKTGRVVIVHEAPLTLGFGAEIAATITQECFDSLEAPPLRVTGLDTPYPPAKNENDWVPSVNRILAAVSQSFSYSN